MIARVFLKSVELFTVLPPVLDEILQEGRTVFLMCDPG
jgi:hypothetical protein